MSTKTLYIVLPEIDELPLEVEFTYSYDPGKYHGLPENCYPEEEEAEVTLPDNYEQIIFDHYLRAARVAIKHVENHVNSIKVSEVAEWAEEISGSDC